MRTLSRRLHSGEDPQSYTPCGKMTTGSTFRRGCVDVCEALYIGGNPRRTRSDRHPHITLARPGERSPAKAPRRAGAARRTFLGGVHVDPERIANGAALEISPSGAQSDQRRTGK